MTDTTLTTPTARRRHPLRLALVLATLLLLVGAAAASAAPNPTANITPGPLPRACNKAPHGAACIDAVIGVLNAARADLGLGPYVVPADFASLSGAQQLLILCNLDRLAYGLPPIAGETPALNTVAAGGVSADNDPDPSALLTAIPVFSWTSNWAGAYPNAPEAYYAWMYYDGWSANETSNLDCTSATASGCWGHRQDVLSFATAGVLSMGAFVGKDAHGDTGYAMTLVWTPGPTSLSVSYSYSWARAQADGAGAVAQRAAAGLRQKLPVGHVG
jgi:hypothetical protein